MKMTAKRIAALAVLVVVVLLVAVPLTLGSVNAPPVVFFGLQVPLWALLLGAFVAGVVGCVAVFSLPLHWANRDVNRALNKDVNHALNRMESEIHALRNRRPEYRGRIVPREEIGHGKIKLVLGLINDRSPKEKGDFFEGLVRDILLAMGYGFAEEAGYVIGGSGDRGVDVIIHQDPLGYDPIYAQVKCLEGKVGPDKIRDFRGALDMRKAVKGIFFTTSFFTGDAKRTADISGIRLVDGNELVQLMFSYGVGFKGGEVDKDYF